MPIQSTPEQSTATSSQPDSSTSPARLLPTASRVLQLTRALDYEARSLAVDDPLDACLGAMNAGLIRTYIGYQEAIESRMAHGPNTVEGLGRLTPAVEAQLRVLRQIERFVQLQRRAARGESSQ